MKALLTTSHPMSVHYYPVIGLPADPIGWLVIQIWEYGNYFEAAIRYWRDNNAVGDKPDFEVKKEDNLNSETVAVPPLESPDLLEFRAACEKFALANIEQRGEAVHYELESAA